MTREELLQSAKPILFITDMVQAILDGSKTVTRRVVKLPKYIKAQENGLYTLFSDGTCYENQRMEDIDMYLNKPFQPGDILYVRETWRESSGMLYARDSGAYVPFSEINGFDYLANYKSKEDANEVENERTINEIRYGKWRPSIHMPKEAARIFLKVKDVRVERLQDMRSEDALNEGIKVSEFDLPHTGVVNQFKKLWNSTIKKSDIATYGWGANPWVWVIEFERIEMGKE